MGSESVSGTESESETEGTGSEANNAEADGTEAPGSEAPGSMFITFECPQLEEPGKTGSFCEADGTIIVQNCASE